MKAFNRHGREVTVTVPENEPRLPWVVRCRCFGGRTGDRTSLLKSGGELRRFATEAEAAAAAQQLSELMNGNPYRTATFQYWAEEVRS